MKEAGIGTYQIFMETYHHETYQQVHPQNTLKGDYLWRLDALNRAFESGCDDVGIGALFGLYDWRFEVLGLVAHSLFCRNITAWGRTPSAFQDCNQPWEQKHSTLTWLMITILNAWWPFCVYLCPTPV